MYDVAIIGAGVIGSMLARELTKYKLQIVVLEKENDVACGASKANSGIVHGGYDPMPGSLKAKLNAAGVEKLFDAAAALHVPIKRNGSFVCAFGEDEDKTVQALYERGIENGIPGMSVLSGDEARQLEPALSEKVTSVLSVTNAGIVCPYELTVAAMGNAMDNGAHLKTNFAVTSICKENGLFVLQSASGDTVKAKYLLNCAGGYSDKIAAMAGDGSFRIIPRAGEYMLLDKAEGNKVRHTIFQVPTKEGKGILVTPTVDDNLLTGPTAAVVSHPEDTKTTAQGIQTVKQLAAKSVPSIAFAKVITSFAGVRASEENGDFIIEASSKVENLIQVAAVDSPGLTCCVSIAEYAAKILRGLAGELEPNKNWNGSREDPHFFRKMNDADKDAYIKEHPAYGKIVCRCETVSEGEIRQAIRRNPPARDVDGVKRRTRSGMGRCQGGFCGPYVMQLIAEEAGIPMEEVTKKGTGSEMVIGKI